MSVPKIHVIGRLDGFVIEMVWPDGVVELAPGVFISEAAAEAVRRLLILSDG